MVYRVHMYNGILICVRRGNTKKISAMSMHLESIMLCEISQGKEANAELLFLYVGYKE